APAFWQELGAELLIPIGREGPAFAALALGKKAAGTAYGVHDIAFLRAVTRHLALGLTSAGAFARLEELNDNLEREVQQRTAALERTNAYLTRSLTELQDAYGQLERNQTSLMRADRLSTLGRLTAGIAHEVNTPLGAVLNSLAILEDLGREYAESVDDPNVTPKDHREIAREMRSSIDAARGWARKAAAFINKVKLHGREPGDASTETFPLRVVAAEAEALLAHRLRTSSCRLEFLE